MIVLFLKVGINVLRNRGSQISYFGYDIDESDFQRNGQNVKLCVKHSPSMDFRICLD